MKRSKKKPPSFKQVEKALADIRAGRVRPIRMSKYFMVEALATLREMGGHVEDKPFDDTNYLGEHHIQKLRLDECPLCGHRHRHGLMPGEDDGDIRYRECVTCKEAFSYHESEGRLT